MDLKSGVSVNPPQSEHLKTIAFLSSKFYVIRVENKYEDLPKNYLDYDEDDLKNKISERRKDDLPPREWAKKVN